MRKYGPTARPAIDRFNEKYEVDQSTGCWNWTGNYFTNGYGAFHLSGKQKKVVKASRWSYLYFRSDPGKLQVCHSCDNKKCVNPDHLFLGTHKDNMRDMRNKDRAAKGSNNGFSKLKESQVLYILNNPDIKNMELAKKFRVHRSTIEYIKKGKNWGWIQ